MTHDQSAPTIADSQRSDLFRQKTFDGLSELSTRLGSLDTRLREFCDVPDRAISANARKLRKQIREFEPSITMIGQVKAGKTTLVNAMVGWKDLLPADVNPWTSVVTSLHMQPHLQVDTRRSSFRFFSNEEWDHLICQGGRVGEIAARAGAQDELEKVRRQLDEMREKSQKRLGRRFQMLLGQTHDYERFDEALIQRYVCMGDDFWEEADGSSDQGRFADITKSADLWFAAPDMPCSLCIQDTPGVNDTFMIREQITINALRGSRLCVMVLSAQQALSSVDLGLIRLISNVKSRDVIIFVNRIDELADPAREVPEIRQSITETLKKFDGPTDAEIIFGSGYWASHAVGGTCDQLGEESAAALLTWAASELGDAAQNLSPEEAIWTLSGLPALGNAISQRVAAGVGTKLEERLRAEIENLKTGLNALENVVDFTNNSQRRSKLSADEIRKEILRISRDAHAQLDQQLFQADSKFSARIENARQTFLSRATGSLIKHLEVFGEGEIWTYDPSGLRILLRSAYQVFARSTGKSGQSVYEFTAAELGQLYARAFDMSNRTTTVTAPPIPSASAPVALGQTIALDLRGSWWTRFWRRRRGYQAFADDFAKLIDEETVPIISALKQTSSDAFADAIRSGLQEFLDTQRDLLVGLAEPERRNGTGAKRAGPTCPTTDHFEFTTSLRTAG